jgi:magnesium transporter
MKPMNDTEKWKLLAEYDANQAASVMGETDVEKAAAIAESLGVSYMVEVVSQLDSDAAADLLRSLPDTFRAEIIKELKPEKAQLLAEILSYAPGSAGSIMSKEFLSIGAGSVVQQVIDYLQNLPTDKKGKVSYIYVVDPNQRLEGVIQIRDLIFHPPATSIKKILKSPVYDRD